MSIDYKSAGVDINAGDEVVERIKKSVKSTFTPNVLADIGGFGSLYDLKLIINKYENPVLVQSIDGVGTKMIVARMAGKYETIGIDLLSACCNDIIVQGAKPFTFLDYIANDKLNPVIIEDIVRGISEACREINVSLVGGETAEMPDTYLPGEHDLVGIVTGLVEKEKIISGKNIVPGDIVVGISSSGLHTNGYSLVRKILFAECKYQIDSILPGINRTVEDVLLEPHINYTLPVLELINAQIEIHGMAHITGGGLIDNIPRILPANCAVEIEKGVWTIPDIFQLLQKLGSVDETVMYRTFNMGVGLCIITTENAYDLIEGCISNYPDLKCFLIGKVIRGNKEVLFRE